MQGAISIPVPDNPVIILATNIFTAPMCTICAIEIIRSYWKAVGIIIFFLDSEYLFSDMSATID